MPICMGYDMIELQQCVKEQRNYLGITIIKHQS